MTKESDRTKRRFPISIFHFRSNVFQGADEAKRVAAHFVNVTTYQEVRGFNIDHELDHALSDRPMLEEEAEGRFLLHGISVDLPGRRRWVVAVPEYEPMGKRTKDEWKAILNAPRVPSPIDVTSFLKLKLWRQ